MKFKFYKKKAIAIFLVFLLVRLILLFTSQRSLGGDPAIFASMAKNTYYYGENHFYIYGEPYIGGAAIESYLAVIPFYLFGVSDLSFRLVSFSVSLLLAVISYFLLKKFFSVRIANIFLLLAAVAPMPFITMNIEGRGGYMEAMLFFVVLCYLFYEIFYENKNVNRNIVLFGLTSGIAYWNYEYILPFLMFFFIFWYLTDKKLLTHRTFWLFAVSLLVAMTPVIYYNITHNFSNIEHFMAGNAIHRFACDHNLLSPKTQYGNRIIDPCKIFEMNNFKPPFSFKYFIFNTLRTVFANYLYYAIVIALIGYLIWINRKAVLLGFKSVVPSKKYNLNLKKTSKEVFLLGFSFFWIIAFILSGWMDDRHFLPIFPIILMTVAISIGRLQESKNFKMRMISWALLSLLLLSALMPLASAFFKPDKENISGTIDFLNQNNITHVYTNFPNKWKILFYTRENIIASCNICPCPGQYPGAEKQMINDKNTAYLFQNTSLIGRKIISYLNNASISYNNEKIDSSMLIYNLSEPINVTKIMPECEWTGSD